MLDALSLPIQHRVLVVLVLTKTTCKPFAGIVIKVGEILCLKSRLYSLIILLPAEPYLDVLDMPIEAGDLFKELLWVRIQLSVGIQSFLPYPETV